VVGRRVAAFQIRRSSAPMRLRHRQRRRVVDRVLGEMHHPNAIDKIRFSASVAFPWRAIAKPRFRRPG
jgi:hypothetical protein